jgi:hypothetical protein
VLVLIEGGEGRRGREGRCRIVYMSCKHTYTTH